MLAIFLMGGVIGFILSLLVQEIYVHWFYFVSKTTVEDPDTRFIVLNDVKWYNEKCVKQLNRKDKINMEEALKRFNNGDINSEQLFELITYDFKQISHLVVGQSRWGTTYRYIVQDDSGKYWECYRTLGSTECQDDDEFDIHTITEVEPYEKVVIDYKPVDKY